MARSALVLALLAASLCGSTTAGCNGAVINLAPDAGGASDGGTADPASAFTTATKSSGGALLSTRPVDKVDILFDVDNSASMGDKQYYLQAAIPDLVNRLINPNCVDPAGATTGSSTNGLCVNAADHPEFTPVHDLHIGLVTSSLGPRGGDACSPNAMARPFSNVSAHNDDQAHLLNRTLTFAANGTSVAEGIVADAPAADPYLYWFPAAANMGKRQGPGQTITTGLTLIQDFTDLVGGAGVFGCGLESQLESWYRFLVQPDPYASISIKGNLGNATGVWNGVDQTILQQRHDFLRPDSVVLIVDLSDENDSEIDVRSIGGLGVNWLAGAFQPPNGTSACASNPASPACQSCAIGSNAQTDPQCKQKPNYMAVSDWGYDLNLRHVHMKAKYGLDPQYPIERYLTGLTSTTVPDRNGEYPSGASSYVGTQDCQNPLFAGALPDGSKTDVQTLCHAPPGTRRKDLVFFAHIGGVPSQLLHFDPSSMAQSALSAADWVKILGKDPESYDYSGIDPHMIESADPRAGLAPPGSASNADAIDGHEWTTSSGSGHILQVDLQYACTFPLTDSKGNAAPRDCTLAQNQFACDCPHTPGSVTPEELPPICDTTTQTTQLAAKAYPTVRELLLTEKLGKQGIVSSICPIDVVDNATQDDPLFGYRPAVALIADRLKDAFTAACLPAPLPVARTGGASCRLLMAIPGGVNGTGGSCLDPTCPLSFGLTTPDQGTLSSFCQSEEDAYHQQVSANGGSTRGLTDPANVPVCELMQLVPSQNLADFQGGTCAPSTEKGWCYVTGTAAGTCSQTVIFANNAIPTGATAQLLCTQ